MGAFHISCRIENHIDRSRSVRIPKLLVDTGSEYTWVPVAKLEKIAVSIDEVGFAEPGDLILLGARTLEGLNLTVDAIRKKLVAAGPLPAV